MPLSKITRNDPEVHSRLTELGLSKPDLVRIVQEAVSAKNESVPIDPLNAPGTLAYIHGIRAKRQVLLPQGWEIDRTDNIEATYNPITNIKLVYQNADTAADPIQEPKAISGKGTAADRMVDQGQQTFLFPDMQKEEEELHAKVNSSIWFLCVATKDDDVMAELSCPKSIDCKQFNGFHERIFIVKSGDWNNPNGLGSHDDDSFDVQDFEISISRK